MHDELQDLFASLGVTEEEVAAELARGEDELALALAERVALPGPRHLTPPQVWERAAVDEATARQLWRAMGFPHVPDDRAVMTDADADALRLAAQLLEGADIEPPVALQQTRTMGQAMARIADAQQDVIEERTGGAQGPQSIAAATELAQKALPAMDRLIVYLYRRHLAAATRRALLLRSRARDGAVEVSVGFADMVGYTALSRQLDEAGLAATVDRFGTVAGNTVAAHGGRVVKMIGDEVMFSAEQPEAAARLSLDLLEAYAEQDEGPTVRVGIAHGAVLARDGDLFGPTVNLASRLAAIARPSSILVNDAMYRVLSDRAQFAVKATRPRHLKGFGRVRTYVLRPA